MSGWGSIIKTTGGGGVISEVTSIGQGQVQDTAALDQTESFYGEALSVASGSETTILTKIAPAVDVFHVIRVEFGGKNLAQFFLYVDGVKKAQHLTWWTSFTGTWEFKSGIAGGLIIDPGAVIEIKCLHNRPYPADFFARLETVTFQ